MDSLGEILSDRKFVMPDEMAVVKDYVKLHWNADCSVTIQHNNVILSVSSSALAATIQLHRQELIKSCNLGGKKLVIRHGR